MSGNLHVQVFGIVNGQQLASHLDKLLVVDNALGTVAAGNVYPEGWLSFSAFYRIE